MSLATNEDRLVRFSVMGTVVHPTLPGHPAEPYRLASDGTAFLLPSYGGIVYNVSVGDSAFGWAGDCIHPGISVTYPRDDGNRGLNIYACVGNRATVATVDGRRLEGTVTGKSGRFSEHVIVHLPKAQRQGVTIGDRVVIRAEGVGMQLTDFPTVRLKSLAPALLAAMGLREQGGTLQVPVAAIAPAHLVGAGAGLTSEGGSLHLQSTDRKALEEHGLASLRLGDLVGITDYDSSYQHGYFRGATGIAVVGQTDGPRAGFGPGMTLLMTDRERILEPVLADAANLKDLIGLED